MSIHRSTRSSSILLLGFGLVVVARLSGVGIADVVNVVAAQVPVSQGAIYEAAKKEGKLVWYMSGFDLATAEQVAAAFKRKYPGIEVDVVRATGGVNYQRLLQESKAGVYANDLFQGADEGQFVALKQQGLLLPYMPVDADKVIVEARRADPEGYYHINTLGFTVIMYNTAKVPAKDAPKKWTDLLEPQWKGKIAMGHPAFSNYQATQVLQLTKMYGWEYWEKFSKQDPQVGRSIISVVAVVASAEREVGISSDNVIFQSQAKGDPVRVVYPEDGTIYILNPIAIMKRAPHPNAAKLFMDFTTSIEYSDIIAKNYFHPIRPEVRLPDGMKRMSELKAVRPPLDELAKEMPKIIDKFRSTFGV
jgi:iron(III) transport system substrate-binding protein